MSQNSSTNVSGPAQLVRIIGYILGFSYPILALSGGVRGFYQLFFRADIVNKLGPALSIFAAILYITASFGFVTQRKWAWQLSVGSLIIELIGILTIGTITLINPQAIPHTLWEGFGADYGYFPLFQPVLGLIWLFWPGTLKAYGIR